MTGPIACGDFTILHTGPGPYAARPASDRDANWPHWIVTDRHGFNGVRVEGKLFKLFSRETALAIADALNSAATASGGAQA